MAKRNHSLALYRGQRGQISIFFSASLVVLVSIVAFVINVGLFVKAKINLQNSTDAAAFAGAAVQSRQLSKIAHLNWEMRNIYKEWLYKYYVIGNLNINGVKNATPSSPSGQMDFRMEMDVNAITQEATPDPYNIPSICIHLAGSKTNICKRYAIPGLPEFGSSNLPGAEAASRAFQDALISTKVNDCVARTQLNMYVASMWAYNVIGVGGNSFATQGPAIMADRQGAWPKAVELALRIRNLERIVNREARSESVCIQPGLSSEVSCGLGINSVSSEPYLGNERLVKAFYTGYRNIGGSYDQDEMKNSFTLTELKPRLYEDPSESSASNLLLLNPYPKQYLDLKLMMVNYAIFYSAMIPRADTQTSGACDVSKAAIPVPGYPLGFYKSPNIITYYAVKGEAEFTGMFNPFGSPVKLTAYAAAKPMGGRIGPMLFTQRANSDAIIGRNDTVKRRSVPYMLSINVLGTVQKFPDPNSPTKWTPKPLGPDEFAPGVIMPINGSSDSTKFWLTDLSRPVGGKITDAGGVQFGLPNLVYDFENPYTSDGYTDASGSLYTLNVASQPQGKPIGLYNTYQFGRFKGSLGSSVSGQTLVRQVARVRAPTLYEAANYLIPVPFRDFSSDGAGRVGHFGQVVGTPQPMPDGLKVTRQMIYAPLFSSEQEDVIYKDNNDVVTAISNFMKEQETGIRKYLNSMNLVAKAIKAQAATASEAATGSAAGYEKAATGVSDINLDGPISQYPKTCGSLAGTFLAFYYGGFGGPPDGWSLPIAGTNPVDGTSQPCPTPLRDLIQQYFSNGGGTDFSATHYTLDLSWKPNLFTKSATNDPNGVLTAYVPGPFTGVDFNGNFSNLAGLSEIMRRNFYSTKLVKLKSLLQNEDGYKETTLATMAEGDTEISDETKQSGFYNALEIVDDISAIKH